MATTFTTSVKLVAIDGVSGVMSRVGVQAAAMAKRMQAANGNMASSYQSAVAAFAGGAAVQGMMSTMRSLSDEADRVVQQSKMLGMAAEEFQGLAYAAQQANVEREAFERGLAHLSGKVFDVAKGGAAGAAARFRQMGVAVTDATGRVRARGDILMEVADKFAAKQKEIDRLRASGDELDVANYVAEMENAAGLLFGARGMRAMNDFLAQGSAGLQEQADKARRIGAVMSEEVLAKIGAMGDSMDTLGFAARGAAAHLFADRIKQIGDVAERAAEGLGRLARENPQLMKFAGTVASLAIGVIAVGAAAGVTAFALSGLAPIFAVIGAVGLPVVAGLAAGAVLVYKNWDRIAPTLELVGAWFGRIASAVAPVLKQAASSTWTALVGTFEAIGEVVGSVVRVFADLFGAQAAGAAGWSAFAAVLDVVQLPLFALRTVLLGIEVVLRTIAGTIEFTINTWTRLAKAFSEGGTLGALKSIFSAETYAGGGALFDRHAQATAQRAQALRHDFTTTGAQLAASALPVGAVTAGVGPEVPSVSASRGSAGQPVRVDTSGAVALDVRLHMPPGMSVAQTGVDMSRGGIVGNVGLSSVTP